MVDTGTTVSYPTVKVAPSLLAADFTRLGDQAREAVAAGADRLHLDIMDGHFVPNISFGPLVVQALRPIVQVPLEVHLMISNPDAYLDAFANAGADTLIVHVENAVHLHRTVHRVRELRLKVGIALNPATSVMLLDEMLPEIDLALIMTVNPGFGGQAFLPVTLGKIRSLADRIATHHFPCEIEVDGGIDARTAPQAVAAGATVLVAGSAVFRPDLSVRQAMDQLHAAVRF